MWFYGTSSHRCFDSCAHATLQILTKSLTAAVLNAIGDLIAQLAVEKKEKLDWARFIRFAGLVS